MRSIENIIRLVSLIGSILVVAITVGTVYFEYPLGFSNELIITILLGLIFVLMAFSILRNFNKNPLNVTISLIGFPGTGKTVFLTVLFDQLQRHQEGSLKFSPFGDETIERITTNLKSLRQGEWLPRTRYSETIPYNAYASISSGFFQRRYKINAIDFAGEHIDELNPESEAWLHKTSYFEYAIKSDAIILGLDISIFLKNRGLFESQIESFIAVVQILSDKKGIKFDEKLKEPISIVFFKYDLIDGDKEIEEEIKESANRLLQVCKNRSKYASIFFVSSVGELTKDGLPKSQLSPVNVVRPLVYLLKKYRE